MRYYKPISFALMFLVLAVLALCFAPGCALSKPQKTIVLNLAAWNCGVVLAQENPALSQDILKYSKALLDTVRDTEILPEPDFNKWIEWMINQLDFDPFLKMNFQKLIKLVDIEITLAGNQQEIAKLAYGVIRNFIIGIKAGK